MDASLLNVILVLYMKNFLVAIVPNAGIGNRFSITVPKKDNKIPKQYWTLAGVPVLRHTILALLAEPRIMRIVVATSKEDKLVEKTLEGLPKIIIKRCGGSTRAKTVMNALLDKSLFNKNWVLVHDAVRPGLPLIYLSNLIDICFKDSVGGILAMPIIDSIKNGQNRINKVLINRKDFCLAQTPQMFRADILKRSLINLIKSNMDIPDEATAIVENGYRPLLLRGTLRNFKLTWYEDLEIMEKLL